MGASRTFMIGSLLRDTRAHTPASRKRFPTIVAGFLHAMSVSETISNKTVVKTAVVTSRQAASHLLII